MTTLAIIRNLEAAGFERKAAEAVVESVEEVVKQEHKHLATKGDFIRLEGKFGGLEVEMRTKFNVIIGLLVGVLIALVVQGFKLG